MELIINSKKHGEIKYLIDDEDYNIVKNFIWHVYYDPTIKGFYVTTNIKKNNKRGALPLHRLIMEAPNGMVVDHINHNTLDNRKCNLRICTNSENKKNSSKQISGITSKYKGVSWHKGVKKFVSQISFNNKKIHLGYFNNEIDAAKCYNIAANKFHGEFANLNEVII